MAFRALLPPALALALALPAGAWGQAGGEATARDGVGIRGVVLDRETREPLEGAGVTLEPVGEHAEGQVPRSVLTDPEGRFVLGGLQDGSYRIAIERLGYGTVSDSLTYRSAAGLRIEVEMVAEAVELEPLLVVTEARSRVLLGNGFYERRRRGIGRFLTREEDAVHTALRASDLFRGIAGVRMSSVDRFGQDGVVLFRNGCVADVYLDGVRTSSPFPMDALVSPGDLEAVEVYRGAELPSRFGTTSCGAVLIWTHVPNPGTGEPFSWTKLLVAVGVFGVSFLLW